MTAYQSQPSRQSTQPQPSVLLVPTTAEPISYLHQPEASTSASPAESSSGPQRIQPSRRATTGSPRPPSASSATTQRSSKELTRGVSKGKERSNSTGPGLFGAVPAAAAALGFNSGGPQLLSMKNKLARQWLVQVLVELIWRRLEMRTSMKIG